MPRIRVMALVLCIMLAVGGCMNHISPTETAYQQIDAQSETVYLKPSHPEVKSVSKCLAGYAQARYTVDYRETDGQEEYEFYTPEFREWRLKEGEDKMVAAIYKEQEYVAEYLGSLEVAKMEFDADFTNCEVEYSFQYELSATPAALQEWGLSGPGTYQLHDRLWFKKVDKQWYVHDYDPSVKPTPIGS